jgi:hypothetical protein
MQKLLRHQWADLLSENLYAISKSIILSVFRIHSDAMMGQCAKAEAQKKKKTQAHNISNCPGLSTGGFF